jgi:hypothetical protein
MLSIATLHNQTGILRERWREIERKRETLGTDATTKNQMDLHLHQP